MYFRQNFRQIYLSIMQYRCQAGHCLIFSVVGVPPGTAMGRFLLSCTTMQSCPNSSSYRRLLVAGCLHVAAHDLGPDLRLFRRGLDVGHGFVVLAPPVVGVGVGRDLVRVRAAR